MTKPKTTLESRVPVLANLPVSGWVVASTLGASFYYLDAHAPYREIRGYPKDSVEDYCLWLAAVVAAAAIVQGVIAFISILRSAGRLRGKYRVAIGIVLNLLTLPAVLFVLFARSLITPH